ncbi:MAG TPA: glycosyltransferase [Aeromonadales bacterium]|nr:glycosyltransferase [Aeromonadales bacterium]
MKILHLIPSFGSGGAERQLSIIAPALAESGIECHIGYCYEGQNLERISKSSVITHRIFLHNNHDPRLLFNIIRLIRTIKPDLVQTWMLQMDVMGGLAALLTQTPFILSERSSASCYPDGWKFFLRKQLGQRASAIVANSQGGLDYWRSLKVSTPLYLIRNAIISVPPSAGLPNNSTHQERLILFAGRLSPEKNVMLLLSALTEVVRNDSSVVVKLFGEGPLESQLEAKIRAQNLSERIFLEGYTDNLSHWLNQADVCVSISDYEGNPNVVLEAAVQGCPLVLSDIPAHREIFDESSVQFVQHDSLLNIINGILQTLNNPLLSKQKALKAREILNKYEPEKILEQYINLYNKI